jgi:hypothetical protein
VGKIVPLQAKPKRVSLVRSREQALGILLPKFLGVLWDAGTMDEGIGALRGKVTAVIDGKIELGGLGLGYGAFVIHVYAPKARSPWTKVFSAHLGDSSVTVPRFFPYWGGRCGILSWKRGLWEDRIVAENVEPRTFAHLMTAGLTRSRGTR